MPNGAMVQRLSLELNIPEDAPPSQKTDDYRVSWSIEVWGRAWGCCLGFMQPFSVRVESEPIESEPGKE